MSLSEGRVPQTMETANLWSIKSVYYEIRTETLGSTLKRLQIALMSYFRISDSSEITRETFDVATLDALLCISESILYVVMTKIYGPDCLTDVSLVEINDCKKLIIMAMDLPKTASKFSKKQVAYSCLNAIEAAKNQEKPVSSIIVLIIIVVFLLKEVLKKKMSHELITMIYNFVDIVFCRSS